MCKIFVGMLIGAVIVLVGFVVIAVTKDDDFPYTKD